MWSGIHLWEGRGTSLPRHLMIPSQCLRISVRVSSLTNSWVSPQGSCFAQCAGRSLRWKSLLLGSTVKQARCWQRTSTTQRMGTCSTSGIAYSFVICRSRAHILSPCLLIWHELRLSSERLIFKSLASSADFFLLLFPFLAVILSAICKELQKRTQC